MDLASITKKTIDILSRIVKKTPLNHKLLSRPPFRYLHDLISEIIQTTGYAKGLYSDEELLKSDLVAKDKESKIQFLKKIIEVVSLSTKVSVKANPAKIIAGLEVQDTNVFLQILGKAVIKKVSFVEAVAKVTGKAPLPKQKISLSNKNLNAKQVSQEEITRSSTENLDQNATTSEENLLVMSHNQMESTMYAKQSEETSTALPRSVGASNLSINENTGTSDYNTPFASVQDISSPVPENEELQAQSEGIKNDSKNSHIPYMERSQLNQQSEERGKYEEEISVRPTLVRPVTARAAPPKSKKTALILEPASSNINAKLDILSVNKSIELEKSDDVDFFIIDEEKVTPNSILNDQRQEVHAAGSLVREMMKIKLQESSSLTDASSSNENLKDSPLKPLQKLEEIEQFNQFIQKLSDSMIPLTHSLDYIQEDLNSIKNEHDFWLQRRKQVENALQEKLDARSNASSLQNSLGLLEKQLVGLDHHIQTVTEEIKVSKAEIYQNERRIESLLQHIMNPAR